MLQDISLDIPFPSRIHPGEPQARERNIDWLVAEELLTRAENVARYRTWCLSDLAARFHPDAVTTEDLDLALGRVLVVPGSAAWARPMNVDRAAKAARIRTVTSTGRSDRTGTFVAGGGGAWTRRRHGGFHPQGRQSQTNAPARRRGRGRSARPGGDRWHPLRREPVRCRGMG